MIVKGKNSIPSSDDLIEAVMGDPKLTPKEESSNLLVDNVSENSVDNTNDNSNDSDDSNNDNDNNGGKSWG